MIDGTGSLYIYSGTVEFSWDKNKNPGEFAGKLLEAFGQNPLEMMHLAVLSIL